jgi:hydrogenase maturation factor
MCLAIPGKVIRNETGILTVAYEGGVIRQAMAGEFSVKTGDLVLVQMGMVVRKMDRSEYDEVMTAWREAVTKRSDLPPEESGKC